MDNTHGWIDLDPVFLEAGEDVLVIDCLVARVCLGDGRGRRGGLGVGEPVAFGVRRRALDAEAGGAAHYPDHAAVDLRSLAEVSSMIRDWIGDGAALSLLTDEVGDVLVLARGDELLALELEPT